MPDPTEVDISWAIYCAQRDHDHDEARLLTRQLAEHRRQQRTPDTSDTPETNRPNV